jgi:hypothetical protein
MPSECTCQANVHAVTEDNETPLDVAKQAEKTEIQQFAMGAMDSLPGSDGVGSVSEMFGTKTGRVFSVA